MPRVFLAKWARRLLAGAAVAYPLLLVGAIGTLRSVGESWWVTLVALYLPRWGFALPLPALLLALWRCRMRRLLLLQGLSALVLVFPLMGYVVRLPTFASRDKPKMRVLSFNVNSSAAAEAVLGEIDRYSPDVVLLVETGGHRGREAFGDPLRSRYPTVEISHNFILATRYTPSPEEGPLLATDSFERHPLETPLGRIVVYVAHTVSPRHPLFALRGRKGLLREMKSPHPSPLEQNAEMRAEQVQAFSEAAAREADPVILAGDFNLPGLSPLFQRFLSSFDDGFAEAGWGFGYTFPTRGPWMRIDRILARGPLRFVGFDVGHSSSASDHLCVVGDIQRI